MPKPSAHPKGRSLSLTEVKVLFLSLAVTGTLGIWTLLARQADQAAATTNANPDPTGTVPPTPDQSLVLDLPPLPTLVPPAPDTATFSLAAQAPAAAMVSQQQPAAPTVQAPVVQAPAVQAPVKILLGGSKPSSGHAKRTTVTSTRSS
jgi:hypothetical protein